MIFHPQVVALIESNSVVIIHGATGSGKSTQLPQYVLDRCAQRSACCHIAVTQPRKIGASSVARWISRERAWALGGLVGYQVSVAGRSRPLLLALCPVCRPSGLVEFCRNWFCL